MEKKRDPMPKGEREWFQDNKRAVDNHLHKKGKPTFKYKKLNPMENYYKLPVDEGETVMTNPFKDVKDSVVFAKKLREDSFKPNTPLPLNLHFL